ncbi:dUTP diphosphatase [Desulfovibrio oxyclinae]|uniref:dUTP diphosphatase n=1 Tax=Desulfovibrio oxyclinae TaxID=63560 RepID=UPI0003666F5A|nr:dUTP diphosphatase [Desulfovibrio oxyclinae]
MPTIKIKKLHPDAVIPEYAKEGDSGFDLVAVEDATLYPGETQLVKTGIAVELPPGTELQVRPRSGLSLKTPLHIRNAPGTVDNGYRGEVGVICHCLINSNSCPIVIEKGDRIAQGVVMPVIRCEIEEVESLSDTTRGADGYGSTGV